MENKEGQNIPSVTVPARINNEWNKLSTDELFRNKTVIVFSLPGAFTPTCSASHVPRYNQLASEFKKLGVDSIVCVSVNDTFVMNSWKQDQDADNITFFPDGNGEFSEKMGLLVDKSAIGFGKRSWRYSMLVKNKKIEKMFIEPEKDGDPFEVSDADTMLEYISGGKVKATDAVLFGKPGCSYCAKAKTLLNKKGISFQEIQATPQNLKAVSGKATTPQIFINGKYIGGADELEKHFS